MTVLGSSGGGKQVFPVDYEAEICQRLVDAAHTNDLKSACELIDDPLTNVNLVGTVSLKSRKTEIVSRGELPHEVRVEFEEFKTDVTALFLAAHSGNLELLRKLLSIGGNVNEKVFRGYATTASVREGHLQMLEVLINSGASQAACEEALLEASYLGRPRHAQLLMASDMIRPQAAAHALVAASCRGYADVVSTLVRCGVDANANYRVLLQSSKPCLYANVNCNPLVAAIVSRQINVVSLLLQVGVGTDVKVNLGAWSWDMDTGEEFRVGAGLAEAYGVTWCAVEYFEATGAILRMLLHHISPSINIPHLGRTLLHHAILCNNARALHVLINCGADMNSVTSHGETGLMICARHKNKECFKLLASSGADFGLLNSSGQSLASIAESSRWTLGFQQVIIDLILEGKMVKSSNRVVFSPLRFVTKTNEIEALKKLLERSDIDDIDEQDEKGFSAAMLAVVLGHVEAFELLLCAGADVNLQNKSGESVMELLEGNKNGDKFEKVMVKHWTTKTKQESRAVGLHAHALHLAARQGDLDGVVRLIRGGCDVNGIDSEGNSPLMLAAREGQAKVCVVLMSFGAKRDVENARGETALSFARRSGIGSEAEGVILDEEARKLVLEGSRVKKHTKCGKGFPHKKVVRMVEGVGVLRWGKSNRRNVICKAAEVGASERLRWNRRRKFDTDEPGLFHVVTTKNKEVHFVCEGGVEMAQLWVRGIKLVTREAIFGNNSYRLL
ncbi:hypothetical protein UlMin_045634 [Ulmus minor]